MNQKFKIYRWCRLSSIRCNKITAAAYNLREKDTYLSVFSQELGATVKEVLSWSSEENTKIISIHIKEIEDFCSWKVKRKITGIKKMWRVHCGIYHKILGEKEIRLNENKSSYLQYRDMLARHSNIEEV